MNTVVKASAETPRRTYDVLDADGGKIGTIAQLVDGSFGIAPYGPASPLADMPPDPYMTLEAALRAIAAHTGGTCEQV